MAVERLRGRALQRQRERVWLRDQGICARCKRVTVFPSGFELDHIVALANKGTNDDSNMQILHFECHDEKTAEDLGYKPKLVIGLDGFPVERAADSVTSRTARWKRAARG